jgi:hypothetical protein
MRIAFLSILIVIFISCSDKKKVPEDILSQDKMSKVLWDMMRADEWVTYEQTKDTALDRYKRSVELYQKVYQVHSITDAQFKKSFKYYQTRPDLLKPLFDSLQHKSTNRPLTPTL